MELGTEQLAVIQSMFTFTSFPKRVCGIWHEPTPGKCWGQIPGRYPPVSSGGYSRALRLGMYRATQMDIGRIHSDGPLFDPVNLNHKSPYTGAALHTENRF